MPRKTTKLELCEGDFEYLRSLIKQRTIQDRVVIRAHILIDKANVNSRKVVRSVKISDSKLFLLNLSREISRPLTSLNCKYEIYH